MQSGTGQAEAEDDDAERGPAGTVRVATTLEAAVLGWAATRAATGERTGRPLVEVLAADLGLDPDPATLDAVAATLVALERAERIVLDGPVATAKELAPLDLASADTGPGEPAATTSIASYSQLDSAPRHVQLNWALRALRAATDPGTGLGEFDFRFIVAELDLNPKDVRHALESLGLLRRPSGAGPETWWVDPQGSVTAAGLASTERSAVTPPPESPPEAARVEAVAPAAGRSLIADLAPVVESLTRLEPRLAELIHQMVAAAESLHTMAGTQAHLLREQTQEIEALRQDRERMLRDASALRQEIWTMKHRGTRNPEAEELTAEAAKLRAAERRFAGTGSEITDKVRRVNRGLDEVGEIAEGED